MYYDYINQTLNQLDDQSHYSNQYPHDVLVSRDWNHIIQAYLCFDF